MQPIEQTTILIDGPVGKLEVGLSVPTTLDQRSVGLVCHPLPIEGGTMNNKVVTTLVRAFNECGMAAVRFNFRGVGKSEGEFDHAVGEVDDCLAVLDYVQQRFPGVPVSLSGFSFGSYIAAKVAQQHNPECLISIAPPVNLKLYDFETLIPAHFPWLVVQGDQDEVVSAADVAAWAKRAGVEFHEMENVSHFFHGRLIQLRELVEIFLKKTLSKID